MIILIPKLKMKGKVSTAAKRRSFSISDEATWNMLSKQIQQLLMFQF